MSGVLQRITSLAQGLSKAELHVLLALAARAEAPRILEVRASSRELARSTGLARASVQNAIDSLNQKVLVRSDSGAPVNGAVHYLICFASIETEEDKVTGDSEVAQNLGQGGIKNEPRVAQNPGQGWPNS